VDETAHGVFDGPKPDNRQLLLGGICWRSGHSPSFSLC
jgi:hypothetical protein